MNCFWYMQVQLHHGHVFQEDPDLQAQLTLRIVAAHAVMAARLPELVQAALAKPSILTEAVRCVLQRTPATLEWFQLHYTESGRNLASFEAEHAGHLYNINILDGCILLDGSPPSRLPKDIIENRVYRRTFGDCNFEV